MTTTDRAAQRRERILRAAVSTFAERGYAASSTTGIAKAAGASKETLYAYFGDKAGLFREALRSLVSDPRPTAGTPQLSAQTSATEFVGLLQQSAAQLVAELMRPSYLALARVVVAETPRDPSVAEQFREAVAHRALAGVADLLRAGQAQGLVDRQLDPALAARGLVGPLLTYVLLDGLLRPSDDIRPPAEPAILDQISLFYRSVRPATDQNGARS